MNCVLRFCALALASIATPVWAQSDSPPTFTSESELVVLHVAVKDRNGYVGGLEQGVFRIEEDGRAREISFFSNQDAPVTVGLLIDASGSMAPNRDLLIASALGFTKAMNPQDEFFVLGFNETIHLPLPPERPFTSSEPVLRVALVQAIKARGQTALYDALSAGIARVAKGGFERQVLVVLSDGGDNASRRTRAEALAAAQASNAAIYTIALIDPLDGDADPGFLRQLSASTGGLAFKPRTAADIGRILQEIARDIRSMYTIGYVPGGQGSGRSEDKLRRVTVEVELPGGRNASVRTRRAYLAGRKAETP